MIALTVNGKAVALDDPVVVQAFLTMRGISGQAVAVAVNGEVLPRSEYGTRLLNDGDAVEIVRMVGGG